MYRSENHCATIQCLTASTERNGSCKDPYMLLENKDQKVKDCKEVSNIMG